MIDNMCMHILFLARNNIAMTGSAKGEGPREKVHMLRICRGVGVVPSRVIRDEYRI